MCKIILLKYINYSKTFAIIKHLNLNGKVSLKQLISKSSFYISYGKNIFYGFRYKNFQPDFEEPFLKMESAPSVLETDSLDFAFSCAFSCTVIYFGLL